MGHVMRFVLAVTVCMLAFIHSAGATPSSQVRIPSPDVQGYGIAHLGVDTYATTGKSTADGGKAVVGFGLTVGILPRDENVGLEIGVDYREPSKDPAYFNAKLAIQEGDYFPGIAIGGYDFGGTKNVSDGNIWYLLAAKRIASIRFAVGGYQGNDKLLGYTDVSGLFVKQNTGVLASIDFPVGERFWFALDYMGGKNLYGFISAGFSYAVSNSSGFLIGYCVANDNKLDKSGTQDDNPNLITLQYDMNF